MIKGMTMNRFCVCLALCLLALPAVAMAQAEVPHKVALSLVGGLAAASGDAADSWKASYSAGGEVDFALTPQWSVTGTAAYNENKPKYSTSTDKAKVIELGANVKYYISATPQVQPHVRFGGGLYNRDVGSSTTETNFGLSGGAGVDFYLPDSPIGFTLAARFHRVFITSTSIQSGDWEYFNFWGGVRFRIG